MSRLLATVLSALLFCGTPVRAEPVQPSSTAGLPQWKWSGAVGQASGMRIDLVRADVTIVTSTDDRLTVKIVAEGSSEDASRVWIDVSLKNGVQMLSDRYPKRSSWAILAKCLSSSEERGDYWIVTTKFRVVIAPPRGTRPAVTVRSGTVRDLR